MAEADKDTGMELETVDLTPGNLSASALSLDARQLQVGIRGQRGMSAYEYAIAKGYAGTEEEFAEAMAKAGNADWDLPEFKTINGVSILGGGNINITPDGQIQAIDAALSDTSENPVQNKVITQVVRHVLAQLVPLEKSEYDSIKEAGMLQDRVYLVLEEE